MYIFGHEFGLLQKNLVYIHVLILLILNPVTFLIDTACIQTRIAVN